MRFINVTRRNGKRAFGALLLAMAVGAVAPAAQADAAYEIKPRHSDKCLDVEYAGQWNGAGLIQYTCNGGYNQQFSLLSTGYGDYKIVARHSGKCLDVRDWGGAGARIQQYSCTGGSNQRFTLRYVGYSYYEIVARHSGMCADVAWGSTADFTPVNTWYCNGGSNQQFRFEWR